MARWILLLWLLATAQVDAAFPGQRHALRSRVLDQQRSYQVYLPPAYAELPEARFPVLYVIDGAYHFPYVAGLVEQMATSGEQIPELIVVALDDRGKDDYRAEVAPALGAQPGRAPALRRFLLDELRPEVEARYRTAPQRLLMGQSMGGLFVIDTLLAEPEAFDDYIAISPSLWWQDQALQAEATRVFGARSGLRSRLWLSLGSERGMGVLDFVGLLDRSAPAGLHWSFQRFSDDNHGAVTLPALRWSLSQVYAGFELTRARFEAAAGPAALVAEYQSWARARRIDPLPGSGALGNLLQAYHERDRAQADDFVARMAAATPSLRPRLHRLQAEQALRDGEAAQALTLCEQIPDSTVDAAWCAALALQAAGDADKARARMQRALELGREQLRDWRLLQLHADARGLGLEPPAFPGPAE